MSKSNNLIPTGGPTTEFVEKRLKITFKTGLPRGTRGEFVYEGEEWIAFPVTKSRRILSVIDQLISYHARIRADLVGIINDHPEDAKRVAYILKKCAVAKQLEDEMVKEKVIASTL